MNVFEGNVASQNGEDGIIQEIFARLERKVGSLRGTYAFECGAWDGKHLSNTWFLTKTRDVKVVAVECDDKKFEDLKKTAAENRNIIPVHAKLVPTEDSIGKILDEHAADKVVSLMSIDIDGLDYDVWKAFRPRDARHMPLVVVIEINSSIPPWKTSDRRETGASFIEMYELGMQKGYVFVAHTGNMIFVREDVAKYVVRTPPKIVESFKPLWLAPEDRLAFSRLCG